MSEEAGVSTDPSTGPMTDREKDLAECIQKKWMSYENGGEGKKYHTQVALYGGPPGGPGVATKTTLIVWIVEMDV